MFDLYYDDHLQSFSPSVSFFLLFCGRDRYALLLFLSPIRVGHAQALKLSAFRGNFFSLLLPPVGRAGGGEGGLFSAREKGEEEGSGCELMEWREGGGRRGATEPWHEVDGGVCYQGGKKERRRGKESCGPVAPSLFLGKGLREEGGGTDNHFWEFGGKGKWGKGVVAVAL